MSTRYEAIPATAPALTPSFRIDTPLLSRGNADRSEDLREPARIEREWPRARVLTVDRRGRAAIDPGTARLDTRAALSVGDVPPVDAVLLGAVGEVDHWAVPGDVDEGGGLREWGALLPDADAGLLTTATALLSWHAAAGHCPRCGEPNTPTPAGWSRICPNDHQEFPRTDPAVIVLVHDGIDSIVLARQPIWPAGRVSVLAGFVEAGESLEGTVVREVLEEVGLYVNGVGYLGSQPWPFPRSLMIGFEARAERGAPMVPRDGEIEEARWYHRDEIRAVLAAEADNPGAKDAWLTGSTDADPAVILPGQVSIARRMIEGWAARS
ncbi:NAD(+) diphosphatase [Nakamurella sp. GG22]